MNWLNWLLLGEETSRGVNSPEPMPAKKEKSWSQQVTETSNALDLEPGVFSWEDPRRIAESLKRSADTSARRKASPFTSAMSMLNFYINRAGKNLPPQRLAVLEKTKDELRALYGRARHSAP